MGRAEEELGQGCWSSSAKAGQRPWQSSPNTGPPVFLPPMERLEGGGRLLPRGPESWPRRPAQFFQKGRKLPCQPSSTGRSVTGARLPCRTWGTRRGTALPQSSPWPSSLPRAGGCPVRGRMNRGAFVRVNLAPQPQHPPGVSSWLDLLQLLRPHHGLRSLSPSAPVLVSLLCSGAGGQARPLREAYPGLQGREPIAPTIRTGPSGSTRQFLVPAES